MQTFVKRGVFLVSRTQLVSPAVRYFGNDPLKEQERAAEKIYFDKEERRVMKKLLDKLDKESKLDKFEAKRYTSDDARKLQELFRKHGVNADKDLIEDIIEWKHED